MVAQFEAKYRVKGDELSDEFFNRRFKDIDLRLVDLEQQLGQFDAAVDALIAKGLAQINTELQASIDALQADVEAANAALAAADASLTALQAAVDDIINGGTLPAEAITVSGIAGIDAPDVKAALAEHQGDIDAINAAKGAANGFASLDSGGKVPTAQLPATVISDVFEVGSEAAMLALAAQRGDIAIRTDLNKCFVLSTDSPGTLADWKVLRTPTDAVLSVAGLTGAITGSALKTELALAIADIVGLQTALDGKEVADANIVKGNATKALSAGYTAVSLDKGSKSSGTFTPDPAERNIQHFTNDGAFTLAPFAAHTTMVLDQINGATAGAITRTGFTKVTGDTLATTAGLKYRHFISVGQQGSHIHTQAMQ